MTYWNLVTSYESLGYWKGGMQKFAAKCDQGCAVLVHKDTTEGIMIGAAQKK